MHPSMCVTTQLFIIAHQKIKLINAFCSRAQRGLFQCLPFLGISFGFLPIHTSNRPLGTLPGSTAMQSVVFPKNFS